MMTHKSLRNGQFLRLFHRYVNARELIKIQHLLKLNQNYKLIMDLVPNSNTTLVKVKLKILKIKIYHDEIQIQLLLKLNVKSTFFGSSKYYNSNTTLVKVKCHQINQALYHPSYSNTTLVKVKC